MVSDIPDALYLYRVLKASSVFIGKTPLLRDVVSSLHLSIGEAVSRMVVMSSLNVT